MACAKRSGVGRAGQVRLFGFCLLSLKTLLKGVDLILSHLLEHVQTLTDLTFLVGGNVTEIGHEVIYCTFLAQVLKTQRFKLFGS